MKASRAGAIGIGGAIVAHVAIALAILFSPWFSWEVNALSDLGHSVDSAAAAVFNGGLFLGGFLFAAYALVDLRRKKPWTAGVLLLAGLALQSIGVFDEVYGRLHFAVSVLFFASLWVALLVYAWEARSWVAFALFLAYVPVWALWWAEVYGGGVAVPEILSAGLGTVWLLYAVAREDLRVGDSSGTASA